MKFDYGFLLPLTEAEAFFAVLSQEMPVFAPTRLQEGFLETGFKRIRSFKEVSVPDLGPSTFSPKHLFFPSEETLFSYDGKGGVVDGKGEATPFLVLGLKPCDLAALQVTDKQFACGGYADEYYFSRRRAGLLFVFACYASNKHCFCESMGTGQAKDGYDALFLRHSRGFVIKPGSKEGLALLKKAKLKKIKALPKNPVPSCTKTLDHEKAEELPKHFDSKKWIKLAEKCLDCGACTSVCPTCTCFDCFDENDFKGGGSRKRCWASCMFPSFTRMAGGHCIRQSRESRLKQFAYHKLNYFKDAHGVQMCIGCGRCVDACLRDIDVFDLTNKL
ncbi:MAG: 4Fe-4S dicluster domain-containing protein [Candidatus Micrarchaeota archaeon]